MPTTDLPDWAQERALAYVLRARLVAGVGTYPDAHPVRIVRVTATQVRVEGDSYHHGATTTFRMSNGELTNNGSGDSYTRDDILVFGHDPRVRRSRKGAQAGQVLGNTLRELAHLTANLTNDAVANQADPDTAITAHVTALDAIIDAATEGRAALAAIRNHTQIGD